MSSSFSFVFYDYICQDPGTGRQKRICAGQHPRHRPVFAPQWCILTHDKCIGIQRGLGSKGLNPFDPDLSKPTRVSFFVRMLNMLWNWDLLTLSTVIELLETQIQLVWRLKRLTATLLCHINKYNKTLKFPNFLHLLEIKFNSQLIDNPRVIHFTKWPNKSCNLLFSPLHPLLAFKFHRP